MALLSCVLAIGACQAPAGRDGPDAATVDWPAVGGAADEASYSPLREINADNARRLGLAWYLDLPGEATLEATPLAVNGVIYFSGSYSHVYAVDGVTGSLLWKYDPATWQVRPERMYSLPVNRGLAYADGRIFVGTMDGRLIGLDAATGEQLWSVQTVSLDKFNNVSGAPRAFRDMVIIGNGGADFGARGYVTAYDQATGAQRWRFYTVPGSPEQNRGDAAMERAAATWSGEYWKTGSGGTVWNGMTFDAELSRIYIGTGNGGPYDAELRSPGDGDNLYLASIVALDADTGKYIWHYQANPRESWDYKCTANMIATTLEIDGRERKVLLQAPTNGFFYVLDRETGELLSAEKTGKVTWAERIDLATGRPVELPGMRFENDEVTIFPGSLGGHNFQPMAYSPSSGLVYIPYMQLGSRYVRNSPRGGGFTLANLTLHSVATEPEDGRGALLAWDPVAQSLRWKVQHEHLWNGGTLATAGDLVFQGTADGAFSAYQSQSGERLWRIQADMGILGAPMSFAVDGVQYVSVLAGYGGAAAVMSDFLDVGWQYGVHRRRLLTFALDGTAQLPPSPPRDTGVKALDDPTLQLDEADVAAGSALVNLRCSACHGINLRDAGGPAPDLRESPLALTHESLWSVLHDGALMARGMPRFPDFDETQVRQVHAYIRAGAREALGLREPAGERAGATGL